MMMDAAYYSVSLESIKAMGSAIAAIILVISVMVRVLTNVPAAAKVSFSST